MGLEVGISRGTGSCGHWVPADRTLVTKSPAMANLAESANVGAQTPEPHEAKYFWEYRMPRVSVTLLLAPLQVPRFQHCIRACRARLAIGAT